MKLWYIKYTNEKVMKTENGKTEQAKDINGLPKYRRKPEKIFVTENAFLGDELSIQWQIMQTPQSLNIKLPLEDLKKAVASESRFEVLLEFKDGTIYQGLTTKMDINRYEATATLYCDHVINELSHLRLPTNYAVKKTTIEALYNAKPTMDDPEWTKLSEDEKKRRLAAGEKPKQVDNPAYEVFQNPEWTFKLDDTAKKTEVEYLYSNQDKLQALTDTCKQTDNIFWRVSRTEPRTVEMGVFGSEKDFIIRENMLLGNSFTENIDYQDVINYGIYLTDKSDSGTTALTLRDVYNDKKLHDKNFPIIMTGQEINTERKYNYIDLIPFGSNNIGDYAVLDNESVALEEGQIFEGSFTSNDVQAIASNNKELTDEDRKQAAITLYKQAIRKLKHSRRKVSYQLTLADWPLWINVGDKVTLHFINKILKESFCSNYYYKMAKRGKFYVSSITSHAHTQEKFTYDVVLELYLYNNREV